MSEKLKVFFGIRVASTLASHVAGLLRKQEMSGVDILPDAKHHVTLKFVGPADPNSARIVGGGNVAARAVPRFEIVLSGLGCFPRPECARTLYVGVSYGREHLAALWERLPGCSDYGGYTPHVTVAKFSRPHDLSGVIKTLGTLEMRDMLTVTQFDLMTSRGGRYDTLREWSLRG